MEGGEEEKVAMVQEKKRQRVWIDEGKDNTPSRQKVHVIQVTSFLSVEVMYHLRSDLHDASARCLLVDRGCQRLVMIADDCS